MTPDYFDAEHVGGGRKYIEIEVRVNKDQVIDFMCEIREMVLDTVLQTIDDVAKEQEMRDDDVRALKSEIEELRGGQNEVHKERCLQRNQGVRGRVRR